MTSIFWNWNCRTNTVDLVHGDKSTTNQQKKKLNCLYKIITTNQSCVLHIMLEHSNQGNRQLSPHKCNANATRNTNSGLCEVETWLLHSSSEHVSWRTTRVDSFHDPKNESPVATQCLILKCKWKIIKIRSLLSVLEWPFLIKLTVYIDVSGKRFAAIFSVEVLGVTMRSMHTVLSLSYRLPQFPVITALSLAQSLWLWRWRQHL